MFLIALAFLIQLTSSKKFIKFQSRGLLNKCENDGNYVFNIIASDYQGINTFTIDLKEPSYVQAVCTSGYSIECTIDVKMFPLYRTKVVLPESLSNVDFEYSGWENVISNPVLSSGTYCINGNYFELPHFYPESKEKVEHTRLSDDKYELKIPGLLPKKISLDSSYYEMNVIFKCDKNKYGYCDEDCFLYINDAFNLTHSKSELKCIIEGSKTVEFFPTIVSDLNKLIDVYLHIYEKYNLTSDSSSSSFFYKVDFLLIFLLLILF